MDLIGPVLLQLAISSPLTLIWLVGIVLASLRLKESRFQLVLLAMVLFLVLGVAGTVLNLVLPITLQRQGISVTELGKVLGWVGVIRVLLESVAWGLLLLALFRRASDPRLSGETRA